MKVVIEAPLGTKVLQDGHVDRTVQDVNGKNGGKWAKQGPRLKIFLDAKDDGNVGNKTIAVIDGLWGTRASVPGYQAVSIPDGTIRNGMVRVIIEILSEEGEAEHASELNPSGKGRSRLTRKFDLFTVQCC